MRIKAVILPLNAGELTAEVPYEGKILGLRAISAFEAAVFVACNNDAPLGKVTFYVCQNEVELPKGIRLLHLGTVGGHVAWHVFRQLSQVAPKYSLDEETNKQIQT